MSEESKQKLLNHIAKYKIPVMAFNKNTGDFLQEFDSVTAAAKEYGTSSTNVSAVCKHKMGYIFNVVFIYKKDFVQNKDYRFIQPQKKFTESHRQKLRENCKRNICVYKYDSIGNLICTFISKSDMRRKDYLGSNFLKFKTTECFNGYVYSTIKN